MSSNLDTANRNEKDLAIAKWLCKELKSGNKDSIIEIYNKYSHGFLVLIRSKLYTSDQYKKDEYQEDEYNPEDVLQEFWEILLKGEVFCRYTAKDDSSLKNYLKAILYFHIVNKNRQILRERNTTDLVEVNKVEVNKVEKTINRPKSPEEIKIVLEEERIRTNNELLKQEIVFDALLQLSELSPKDAAYIKMRYFEGLKYKDMAIRELGENIDAEKVKKKTDAIRQQFKRSGTGSEARFKVLLERVMELKNIKIKDFFDEL